MSTCIHNVACWAHCVFTGHIRCCMMGSLCIYRGAYRDCLYLLCMQSSNNVTIIQCPRWHANNGIYTVTRIKLFVYLWTICSSQLFPYSFLFAAVAYGQGVYFALDAKYSAGFSNPDSNGECKMYFARVLTGQFEKGNSSMKTPPSKNDPKNPSLHYDSTVNDTKKPSIFVIYYDNQAYPEYIVTYK